MRRIDVQAPFTLGPSASAQWRSAPEHLAMVLARYRAAAALIGRAPEVLEFGCGEGIGARILAGGPHRELYCGVDRDTGALAAAQSGVGDAHGNCLVRFEHADASSAFLTFAGWDAVVALDVIEHLAQPDGVGLVDNARRALGPHGVFVVGTPSRVFDVLASERSRAEHVYTYAHDELVALVASRFAVVQSFGMQDTALHLGHPQARHYLLVAGIGPL